MDKYDVVIRKKLELEKIENWQTEAVIRALWKNSSWRAPYFGTHGFGKVSLIDESHPDSFLDLYEAVKEADSMEVRLQSQISNWVKVGEWLKEVVFHEDGLNMTIDRIVVNNVGDEGGPNVTISLVTKEFVGEFFQRFFTTVDYGPNNWMLREFKTPEASSDEMLDSNKFKYVFTTVM